MTKANPKLYDIELFKINLINLKFIYNKIQIKRKMEHNNSYESRSKNYIY
jgi:hypothetical protein